MAVNIFTDQMQHAQLFGKPVLATDQPIPREAVPDGWYCYDMQGTDREPTAHAELVDYAVFNRSGTVLSPEPLKQPSTASKRIGKRDYHLHGEAMDLERFCEEYGLDFPDNPIKFEMRPASPDEAGIFYALTPDEDEKLGAIGHVRIDFGHRGREFWSTWWPRGPEELNSAEFKRELDQVVNQLRRGVLQDLSSMRRWCYGHGGEISGSLSQNYGYAVETEHYRYCLRCNPVDGDYQAYLTCFDRRVQQMGLTEKGHQALQNAADPGSPHEYRWYVVENINSPKRRVDHELPLEDAIQLYASLKTGDKQLSVTKDGLASVDLVIRKGDLEWFPEERLLLGSFADDEVVAGAIAQLRQALGKQIVGRISFANGEQFDYTDPQEYIAAIREELPYHLTTGFRYETLTSDPEVRRAVDAELYDLYGMEPPEAADNGQDMAMGDMSL